VLESLAQEAAEEWTANFNPRPVRATDLHQIYRQAL
jgi:alcohol dehydrogenase class IV